MAEITTQDLTEATVEGAGVFDELMRTNKAHLDAEFSKNRIKGPEYAQVYLGAVQSSMQYALQFLLERQRADQQAELVKAQVATEAKQQLILDQQLLNAQTEKATMLLQQAQLQAQTDNLIADGLNIPKQGEQIEAQTSQVTAEKDLAVDKLLTQLADRNLSEANALKVAADTTATENQAGLIAQQTLNATQEGLLATEQVAEASARNALGGHVEQELAQLVANVTQAKAEADLTAQQQSNLQAEALNIPKAGLKLDADTAISTQQKLNLIKEALQVQANTANTEQQTANLSKEGLLADEQVAEAVKRNALNGHLDQELAQMVAQTGLVEQQGTNLAAEALNIPKQGVLLTAQTSQASAQTGLIEKQALNAAAEKLGIDAKTALTSQQATNAIKENIMMDKQICKLEAEFDLLMEQKLKAAAESGLLSQKAITEKAQVSAAGVEPDSIVGRQKAVFAGQVDGYKRDAEQKAAKLMAETWSVRRTTDEGVPADGTNRLSDADIGKAINKMLQGIQA